MKHSLLYRLDPLFTLLWLWMGSQGLGAQPPTRAKGALIPDGYAAESNDVPAGHAPAAGEKRADTYVVLQQDPFGLHITLWSKALEGASPADSVLLTLKCQSDDESERWILPLERRCLVRVKGETGHGWGIPRLLNADGERVRVSLWNPRFFDGHAFWTVDTLSSRPVYYRYQPGSPYAQRMPWYAQIPGSEAKGIRWKPAGRHRTTPDAGASQRPLLPGNPVWGKAQALPGSDANGTRAGEKTKTRGGKIAGCRDGERKNKGK